MGIFQNKYDETMRIMDIVKEIVQKCGYPVAVNMDDVSKVSDTASALHLPICGGAFSNDLSTQWMYLS